VDIPGGTIGKLVSRSLDFVVAVSHDLGEMNITAFDNTPVIDIKPYLPGYDTADKAEVPEWLERAFEKRRAQEKGA
jgi:tRNA (Thr-GGU) A37 N-methylase